jgi:1-aminocyclopropane-1-carboxylate deaminase/D-cysteine desulfhydrase-like pyridoxal-dependent ACC family enzyme
MELFFVALLLNDSGYSLIKELTMRIHNLSLVVALTVSGLTSAALSVASAKPKIVSMGCTMSQITSAAAKQCIDLNVSSEHHVECSGGTISCCNDESDSGGRPAGFCITIKKVVQTKRPKITVAPVETAQ